MAVFIGVTGVMMVVSISLGFSTSKSCNFPPNYQPAQMAYNIMKGNPHDTTQGSDPGFSHAQIFDFQCGSSQWQGYTIPNGTTIQSADECYMKQSVSHISGIQSYSAQLSNDVTVSTEAHGLLWKAQFSASTDYTTVGQQTMEDSTVIVSNYFQCGVYKLGLDTPYNGPQIDENFYQYIKNMPTDYDSNPQFFWKFIDEDYGTHFIESITFGGKFGQNSQFTYYSYSSFTSSNLDINTAASFSTLDAGGAVDSTTDAEKNQSYAFNNATKSITQYSVGGKLPLNGSAETWQNSLFDSPMPIKITLQSIQNLLTPYLFPSISENDLSKKQQALYQGLQVYCMQVAQQYNETYPFVDCAGLPPDLPLPNGSIFGGIYDYSTISEYNVANIYTGLGSCKNPVSQNKPYTIAKYAMCENNNLILDNSVQMDICLNISYINKTNNLLYDPMKYFGGIYTTSCYDWPQYTNIFTKNVSCPKGYKSQKIGQFVSVKNDYSCNDNQMYYCYNPQTNVANSIIGGFFQSTPSPTYNVNNQYTKIPQCPDGFYQYEIAKIVADFTNQANSPKCTPGSIFICLNNIYL